ncbi:Dual specificity protein phosphatase 8 [Dissostichus eleginoides]|uniref:Dual specificity protein phosphatase 8 n=1 Tax=Dissostichus eleginoides TaxID=100907 RepID=A0AAD9BPW1_DISEL|nr:Dual specificity protein phosphatase 8 [Dissostichus eleginoides]
MAGEKGPTKRSAMDIKRLASLIQRGTGRLLVIDSRTFSEYNASHVQGAVNVCCSKLVKRRLQQDKVSVTELLQPNGKVKRRRTTLSWSQLPPQWVYSLRVSHQSAAQSQGKDDTAC